MQPRRDDEFRNAVSRAGGFDTVNAFQNTALRNGNHQDSGGVSFARRIAAGHFKCVADEQFLQAYRLLGIVCAKP